MAGQKEDSDRDHPWVVPVWRRLGLAGWLAILFIIVIVVGLIDPFSNGHPIQEKAVQMLAANNCRQILISLCSYAGDHDAKYPDGPTANDAFRELFKTGLLDDERAFTAYYSPYEPDNELGQAPGYPKALEPGENHWAMTRGLTDQSDGSTPLVFENPVQPSWPPYWNSASPNQKVRGRAWKNQKVVVGRVDGSVTAEPLGPSTGPRATLGPIKDGKNLFDLAGPHEVMDVAR